MADGRIDIASRIMAEVEPLFIILEDLLSEMPDAPGDSSNIYYKHPDPNNLNAGFMITRDRLNTDFVSLLYSDEFSSYNLIIEQKEGNILGMFYGEYILTRRYMLIEMNGVPYLSDNLGSSILKYFQVFPLDTLMRWEEGALSMSKVEGDMADLWAMDLRSMEPGEIDIANINKMYSLFSPLISFAIDQYKAD
ncbi:MAG: hypothetical protein NDI94_02815 [Candidatus Woesearchaeota archaeon]|nr:hypothetical protein [Candidatus Woesearchaeota archaeon]